MQQSHLQLEITATAEVEVWAPPLPDPVDDTTLGQGTRAIISPARGADAAAARLFTLPSPAVPLDPLAADYARESFGRNDRCWRRPWIWSAVSTAISTTTRPRPRWPPRSPRCSQQRRGVCQDFAHLAIAALRGLGLAARYVSGYLETLPPPGQPKLRGADASHAWLAIYCPEAQATGGWVDLDPTNDCPISEQYITTAIGRDYQDVTPVRGVFYGGGEHSLAVSVDVDRIASGLNAAG